MDELRFLSLSSGSNGNCYYVGTVKQGILIDAGIGLRTIRRRLRNAGVEEHTIIGLLITHDHLDHIKSIAVVSEFLGIPVFGSSREFDGVNQNRRLPAALTKASQRIINIGETFQLGDFDITAFHVSHDATDCVGYEICYKDIFFTLFTDLGVLNEKVAEAINRADYLVLEANYDEKMLEEGPYPPELQNRISSNYGHLSNNDTAEALYAYASNRLKSVFLCHLSAHNNTPQTAFNIVESGLKYRFGNKAPELIVLERTQPSSLYRWNVTETL